MSKTFGEIRQIAFVVDDIDAAMRHWAQTLGIGPFFIKRHIRFDPYIYRGEKCSSPSVSIALANSGFIQIELIQQHDELPSIYREFIDAGRSGFQHVSSWHTRDELQRRTRQLLDRGYQIAQQCVIPSSGVQLVYFSTEQLSGGFIFEMSDLMEADQYKRIMNIRSAAEDWDEATIAIEVGQ